MYRRRKGNTVMLAGLAMGVMVVAAGSGCAGFGTKDHTTAGTAGGAQVTVGPFPLGARHQAMLQQALDLKPRGHTVFVVAPGEYYFTDPSGLRVPGDCTLVLRGVRFVWDAAMTADGQTLLLDNVSGVTIEGGEVLGRRDAWDDGVNIAGIRAVGPCRDLRIQDFTCRDLSSNALGFFGEEAQPMSGVSLRGVRGINCCNVYGDYLSAQSGPAKGSDRKDQGTVAMYYVNDWLVDGCRFEGSRSDGTHFFHSHHGRFVNSVVRGSQMGGYFLEGCEDVLASGNQITENGSRGVTIERDSRFCTLANNLVASSGREGLWAPDVAGILVTGNIFRTNGRKDDADKDCEIRLDERPEYAVQTSDIRIEGNLFYSTAEQTAVLYLSDGVRNVVLKNNTFNGPAPRVRASRETLAACTVPLEE